jgi:small-conductance mechanosensitive channel
MVVNNFSHFINYFLNIQNSYFLAFFYFLFFFLVFKLIKSFAISRYLGAIKQKSLQAGGYTINFVRSIKPWFYLSLAFWLAAQGLTLPVILSRLLDSCLVMSVALQIANISRALISHFFKKIAGDRALKNFSGPISFLVFILFIVLGILFVLVIFGVDVTALIAGLGFGGVAIALATQKIFGDLFSAITIYLDRPFVPGDFIVFNNEGGRVEKIGWRSTRLLAESGEELIIANSLLVAGKINNFKKQEKRRGVLNLSFSFLNSEEKLKLVNQLVSEAAKESNLILERSSFVKTVNTSLILEIIYFGSTKQNEYFSATEDFLLKIKKKSEEASILFA